MKKTIYFTIFLLLIINVNAVIDVKIDIQKEFKINEQVNFNYTITSDIDQKIKFIPHSECPNAPIAFLQEKTINLIANEPYTGSYQDILIDDLIEPQTCTAYIQLLEPTQQKFEKTFEIKTNPSFSFDIILAKKIFILNDVIKIDYNSEVENPEITTILNFPDKTTKTISLPYSFKAEQLGTYNLEVTASKQGYKTITKKIQFGVIEKEANIPYVKEVPKKVKEETPEKITKEKKIPYSLIIILFLLIGIITTFIIYRKKIKELLTLAKKHKIKPKDELTDLVNYIKNMLEKGHVEEDIKQSLKEIGWEIHHIEEAFRRLGK